MSTLSSIAGRPTPARAHATVQADEALASSKPRRRCRMADEDKPEYAVGFAKPPRRTRFCKGQSGNPKGRPRGAKNLATLMEKVLKEPVVISENGKRRRITKREALIKQLVNKAIAGDPRSIKLLVPTQNLESVENTGVLASSAVVSPACSR